MMRGILFWVALCCITMQSQADAVQPEKRCLLVNSYSPDYAWQRAVTKSIWLQLVGRCDIREFNLDAKRYPFPSQLAYQAEQAWSVIEQWQPDVVIACDDAASKYLVQPYLKGTDIPVVFCGVNNSGDAYGYPYPNATGMIEASPTDRLFDVVKQVNPDAKRGLAVVVDRLTDSIMAKVYRRLAEQRGLTVEVSVVQTMDELEATYQQAAEYDFLYFSNNAGIADWDDQTALNITRQYSSVLTFSAYRWMSPFVMLTIAHVPEEMGRYTGRTALRILEGESPRAIPVTTNKAIDIIINRPLLDLIGLELPPALKEQAMVIEY
ncbi:ABC transporter substrate-binding protein [Aestuariirhabdus sp. LZHN29]|uniref:ABC transporter substrate-binding protein n=1 Tax=Aestuariirhabdus sp. LZHN29 TaxID=3417462 RepID=UPI003CECFE24